MADVDPIGGLIRIAEKRASKASGLPYTAYSDTCGCSVELAYFTPDSTRQNYKRCFDHPPR